MVIVKQLLSLIKILNSDKGEVSVASGFALGLVAGFAPANPLVLVFLFFLLCIFRFHAGTFFLSWAVLGLVGFALDPFFDLVGYWLLTGIPALQGFWTTLYNLPVVPWTRFNHTVMAGGLFVGLVLFLPTIFLVRGLVLKYRQTLRQKVLNSKFYKALKTTGLYSLYEKVQQIMETVS